MFHIELSVAEGNGMSFNFEETKTLVLVMLIENPNSKYIHLG
jgi:hypothetical protein